MEDLLKNAVYIGWGVATIVVFGILFARRVRSYRRHHDARSRRELLAAFALWAVAIAAGTAIFLALLIPPGTGIRLIATFTALGMYLAAGIVMVTEPFDDEDDKVVAR